MQYRRMVKDVLVVSEGDGYKLSLETRQDSFTATVMPKTVTTGLIFKKTERERFGACELVLTYGSHSLWVDGPKEAATIFQALVRSCRYKQHLAKQRKPSLVARLIAVIKA